MGNVVRGQTIADRAISYIRGCGTGVNTGALANYLGMPNKAVTNALYRHRQSHPGSLAYRDGFWYLGEMSVSSHDAIASSVPVDHDVDPLGDGEESVDDILVGVITDLLEAAAQLESVRARRNALMVRVRDRITEMLTSEE